VKQGALGVLTGDNDQRPALKIVVAYKRAPNPQDATVDAAGVVDWNRAEPGLSKYDPVAGELARCLADCTGGEVIGLTAGTRSVGASLARKAALSRGFDRAVYPQIPAGLSRENHNTRLSSKSPVPSRTSLLTRAMSRSSL